MQHNLQFEEANVFTEVVARIVRDESQTGEKLVAFVLWRKSSGALVLRLNGHSLPAELEIKLTQMVQTWEPIAGIRVELLVALPGVAWMNDLEGLKKAAESLAEVQV